MKISDKDEDDYMPLSFMSTFTNDWVIKCKVTKKYQLKPYQNQNGSGNILKIELCDIFQHLIEGVMFNDAALKFENIIEEG